VTIFRIMRWMVVELSLQSSSIWTAVWQVKNSEIMMRAENELRRKNISFFRAQSASFSSTHLRHILCITSSSFSDEHSLSKTSYHAQGMWALQMTVLTLRSTNEALWVMLQLCFSGLVMSAFKDWQLCVWGLALTEARILHLCFLSLALPSTV